MVCGRDLEVRHTHVAGLAFGVEYETKMFRGAEFTIIGVVNEPKLDLGCSVAISPILQFLPFKLSITCMIY